MNSKAKRMKFAKFLNMYVAGGDMVIYHDETNFNMRTQGWANKGECAVMQMPPSREKQRRQRSGAPANA
ncbi:hypothetical protein V7S43_016629 [Phytophthora oleae]|uniref:PiggyBac transposable element-derived protein domain-containing protein n=1 Tax=Phytophthora oleae TaxID=2107226 RepID=A0ABD3EW38_9STRA